MDCIQEIVTDIVVEIVYIIWAWAWAIVESGVAWHWAIVESGLGLGYSGEWLAAETGGDTLL